MDKQWYWVFHIKGQSSRKYLKDEVEMVSRTPGERIIQVDMKDGSIHFYPVSELNSWHLMQLAPDTPRTWTGRRGAY